MKILSYFLSLSILLTLAKLSHGQYDPNHRERQKFVLQSELPPGYNPENTEIQVRQYGKVEYTLSTEKGNPGNIPDVENTATWLFNDSELKWINLPYLRSNRIVWFLAEPGDSIAITFNGKSATFQGPGAEGWELIYEIHHLSDSMDRLPVKSTLSRETDASPNLNDYFAWNNFLNAKASIILPVIEAYKNKVSKLTYETVKDHFMSFIESRRLWKFNYIRITTKLQEKNHYGLTNKDLCAIYDSTMKGPYADWLFNKSADIASPIYYWQMLKLELYRQEKYFFKTAENTPPILGPRREDSYIKQYALAKKKFKGIKRAKMLGYPFYNIKGIFDDIGFNPVVDSLLNDFYKEQGFEEIKEGVKKVEEKFREKYSKSYAPSFQLPNENGRTISLDQLKGKMVILDFWFTGCIGCVQMTPAIQKVVDHFKNDTNVVFVSISVDKDKFKWLNSLREKKYTTGDGIQLYTNGEGSNNKIISNYYVNSYPSISIIDPGGKLVTYNHYKIDPRKDDGKSMTNLIINQLAISKDGPYIYYNQPDSISTFNFNSGIPSSRIYSKRENIKDLYAFTDLNLPFKITLQKNLQAPPSTYVKPEKILVLSDIEGEFSALTKLLINNKVMDNQFNWTFGKGHLVFAGDMFDRGNQVTECLWLLYTLEEKAKENGGFVHFILGNHEVMNLQGDVRYALPKYQENAKAVNKSIKLLYGSKSELGRWLRTKNIIEKIGNLLILHGGISSQINAMGMDLDEINATAKSCYDCSKLEMTSNNQKLLLDGPQSPIWYRGYYYQGIINPFSLAQLDSTLQKFDCEHIITGHTVIADTISVSHKGKVINTDTRHAEGKSEALLIEGNAFFRVNQEGIRIRLATNPQK